MIYKEIEKRETLLSRVHFKSDSNQMSQLGEDTRL